MGLRDLQTKAGAWLSRKAPALHRFLVRDDKPYPAIRETLGVLFVMLLLVACLWGFTGQKFPTDAPVVVVESGSMMHCTNGQPPLGRDCDARGFARLGTIDPGDLIFVRDVQSQGDVTTLAEGGSGRYGKDGDVIIYLPDGQPGRTPIIHRALLWLEVHGDGTYSVPGLGLDRIGDLDRPELLALGLAPNYDDQLEQHYRAGPEASGWVTKGDNNAQADQGTLTQLPVRPEWVLGKARGEVPWIGLVKLLFTDFTSGTKNYHNAPGDSKAMLFVTLGLLIGGPWAVDQVGKRRRARAAAPKE